MEVEVWKRITDHKKYEVSNFGRIRRINGRKESMKLHMSKLGYFNLTFYMGKCKRPKVRLIHRLVAKAFIRNTYSKPCINHKDGNKLNNNVYNLEWCTRAENSRHAFETGLVNTSGENNYHSKLKFKDVEEIRASSLSKTELAKKYGVSFCTINNVIKRKTWKI